MNEILPNVMKEGAIGDAFSEVIKKHPEKALVIGGVLAGLYLLKDKKISFKLKQPNLDLDIEIKAE